MTINEFIGQQIRKAREEAEMTQVKLGQILDVSRTSVVNLEKGRNRLSIENLYLVSCALEKPVLFFLPSIQMMSIEVDPIVEFLVAKGIDGEDATWFVWRNMIRGSIKQENHGELQ